MFSGCGTRPKSQALPVIQRAQVGRRANNAETLTRELNYGNRQSRVGRSLGFDQREARICEFDVIDALHNSCPPGIHIATLRKSVNSRSEEHTSEHQSLMAI